MHKHRSILITVFVALTTIFIFNLSASDATVYNSQEEKSPLQAVAYSKTSNSPNHYLAYRDIPSLIVKYVNGNKALDYGSGAGCSIQLLLAQNLEVVGVDVSKEMLLQCAVNCPDIPLYLIKNGCIPAPSSTYDLIFSSLVMFELGSEEEILVYLKEAKRIMKDNGVLITIAGSQEMYTKNWFIFNSNYPENKDLKSGDLAKVYLNDGEIEFTDFYWTEADYRSFFKKAGFELVEVHYPLGKENEPYPWKDEKIYSPFIVLVAKKNQD